MSGSDTPDVTQLYPPPRASCKAPTFPGARPIDRLVAEADADYEGLLGAAGARVRHLEEAVHQGARRQRKAPFFKWFEDGT